MMTEYALALWFFLLIFLLLPLVLITVITVERMRRRRRGGRGFEVKLQHRSSRRDEHGAADA